MRLDPNTYYNLMGYVPETFEIRYFGTNVLNDNNHFIFFSCFTNNLRTPIKVRDVQIKCLPCRKWRFSVVHKLKLFSIHPYRKTSKYPEKLIVVLEGNPLVFITDVHFTQTFKRSKHMFFSKVYSNKPCASEVNANLPRN